MLRTHGWKKKYYPETLGYNSRLDALQAAILRVKLRRIDSWNARRRELAQEYSSRLSNHGVGLPYEAETVPACLSSVRDAPAGAQPGANTFEGGRGGS